MDHAPHPAHHPDGLEGEHGIPLNPRDKNPRPLLPPGFPEVHPVRGLHEVDPAIHKGRVLLHDELFPGTEGPGPPIVHSTTPDLIQGYASHRARVAQGSVIVKRKGWWISPPSTPVL